MCSKLFAYLQIMWHWFWLRAPWRIPAASVDTNELALNFPRCFLKRRQFFFFLIHTSLAQYETLTYFTQWKTIIAYESKVCDRLRRITNILQRFGQLYYYSNQSELKDMCIIANTSLNSPKIKSLVKLRFEKGYPDRMQTLLVMLRLKT